MCNLTPPELTAKVMEIVNNAEQMDAENVTSILFGLAFPFPKYTYILWLDGKETVVKLGVFSMEGEPLESAIGYARCNPPDVYDRELGIQIALIKAATKILNRRETQ